MLALSDTVIILLLISLVAVQVIEESKISPENIFNPVSIYLLSIAPSILTKTLTPALTGPTFQ